MIKCGPYQLNYAHRTLIVGILNITPDSFSDGGLFYKSEQAFDHAVQMVQTGADILDIGGESTRPGAEPVSIQEETDRVIPVIEKLADRIEIPASIDTRKSKVAESALNAGAVMVNDVSGLRYDTGMADVISRFDVPVIIMHAKGLPKYMQKAPHYDNLMAEIISFLHESIQMALKSGIKKDRIIIDPGIGFGKSCDDNFKIIHDLSKISALGYPVLMGVSRKSFIGNALNLSEKNRIFGTAAAVSASVLNGANLVRVHDVCAMKQVCTIIDYIKAS